MTIGSKSISQFTPKYSMVNNIVEELSTSLYLIREYSLISFFLQILKESHNEMFP